MVISLIGLLVAVSLPAVHAAREASRRAFCRNSLKQIGIALQGYASDHQVFPAAKGFEPGFKISPAGLKDGYRDYSAHCYLLPYLDQRNVYNSVNFDLGVPDWWELSQPTKVSLANTTVMGMSISVFLCPTDPNAISTSPGRNSYRANVGIGLCGDSGGCGVEDGRGALLHGEFVKISDVFDGMTNTIAFSEKVCGGATQQFSPETDFVFIDSSFDCRRIDSDWMVSKCRGVTQPVAKFFTGAGYTWSVGGTKYTSYTHAGPPNSPSVDCAIRGVKPPCGAFGARSRHPRGVNSLFCDGAVQFIGSSIELTLWRALGTRNGGEVVAAADGF